MSNQLPLDIINIICLFTGKFILLPNGKLKSIIDMRDFQHLSPTLLNRKFFSINSLMRAWDRAEIKYKEEREKEHIRHMQNVDFHRHRGLFLPEEPIENMEPIKSDLFCYHCVRQLSSSELEKVQEIYKKHGSILIRHNRWNIISTYETRELLEFKCCIGCRHLIHTQTPQLLDAYREYELYEEKKEKRKEELYKKKILEKKRGIVSKKNKYIQSSMKPKNKIRSYHTLR